MYYIFSNLIFIFEITKHFNTFKQSFLKSNHDFTYQY